jgi:hypothetical protein
VAFLDTVMNGELHVSLAPGKQTTGVADVNTAFRDKPVAKHDDDFLQRSAGVILLGHTVDRYFSAFHAIRFVVDDKHFLVSGNPVRRDPECFAFVFEFPYHDVSSDPVIIITQALSAEISRIVEMNGQALEPNQRPLCDQKN